MLLFLSGVFLILIQYFTLQVDGNAGQRLRVNAYEYNEKYNSKLELGDCPTRELIYANGTTKIITCPFKHTGDVYFIPLARNEFEVKRVEKIDDVISRVGGGFGIGAGIMGLASVKIKINAAVDTQTSNKQLTLTNNFLLQRGVMTLRNAKPSGVLPSDYPTQLYLSEVALGGEETLLVTMEFETEKKKTEVAITVTVKILWISISAKMKFITSNFRSAAAVKVTRLSTWRGMETKTYVGLSSLESATRAVEEYENDIKTAPAKLLQLPLNDKSLYTEYHFSSWGKPKEESIFNEALTSAKLDVVKSQTEELNIIIKKTDAYLKYKNEGGTMTHLQYESLKSYRVDMIEMLEKLNTASSSYFMMNQKEREGIPDIYGRFKAPFYYMRKLNDIFQPGSDFVYLKEASF